MRETGEVINKSEGAVVSVSMFLLDRTAVQKERKTARVLGSRHGKKRWGGHHNGYIYQWHVICEAKAS